MRSMIALEWVGAGRNDSYIGFTTQKSEKMGQVFAWVSFLGTFLALVLIGMYLASDAFLYG